MSFVSYAVEDYVVEKCRLKVFLLRLRSIQRREEENIENRESIFNEYIDLIIDAVMTYALNRKELLELLKEMKWEL